MYGLKFYHATEQQSHVLSEKRILAAIDHPFVLKLVATYQDKGELMMLLELGLGGELSSLLVKKAPLPNTHARFYYSASKEIETSEAIVGSRGRV